MRVNERQLADGMHSFRSDDRPSVTMTARRM